MLLSSDVHLAPTFAYECSRAVETLKSINMTPRNRKDAVFGGLKEASNTVQVIKVRPKTMGFNMRVK